MVRDGAKRVPPDSATSEAPAEPAENSATETPPTTPYALAQVGADLHSACNYSSRGNEIPAAAGGFVETAIGSSDAPGDTVEATDAPPRQPLPEFASACIRPAIRRRAPRSAGPIGTGPAAMDRLPLAPLGVAMASSGECSSARAASDSPGWG